MARAHPESPVLPVSLLAVALWWLAAPYAGIQHDALYYAGDALRRVNGAALQGDLFFHRHSQGDFSVLGLAYALLIDAVGLDTAAFCMSLAGRVAWLAALASLCIALAPKPLRWWLFILALCLPRTYGPLSLLHTAEPFATPRVWAEAAVLAALALWLLQRRLASTLLALVATALHPLMALPSLTVLILAGSPRVRRAATLMACAAGVAAWCWQIEPMPRLFQQFDDEWWAVVQGRNPMILWGSWTLGQAAHALLALLLLGDTVRQSERGSALRRLALALLAVTVASLALWAWASAYRNVLILQIQPWRVLWLLHLMAPLVWLAVSCRGAFPAATTLALLALAWLASSWAAVLIGTFALWVHARPDDWLHRLAARRGLLCAVAALLIIELAHSAGPLIALGAAGFADARTALQISAFATEPVFVALVLGLAWALWQTVAPLRPLLPVLATTACLAALAVWSSWMWMARPDAGDRHLAHAMRSSVPARDTVWSELGVANTWLHLQRASYASESQGAGAQFDRDAALTLRRRLDRLRAARLTDESWQRHPQERIQLRRPDLPTLRHVCEDRALDWLVFRGSLNDAHVLIQTDGGLTASLYRCASLRTGIPLSTPTPG